MAPVMNFSVQLLGVGASASSGSSFTAYLGK